MKLEPYAFPESEVLRYSQGLPEVLCPVVRLSIPELVSELSNNQEMLRQRLAHHGALLFRNCGIETVEEFLQVLKSLDIRPCEPGIYYGEVARPATGAHTMVATQVPPNFVIGPHNEGDYWYQQPEYLSFFCEATHCLYGQTPIVNGAKIASDLPEELIAKLENRAILTEYVFDSAAANKSLVGEQKRNSWQRMFQTHEKEAVQGILEARDDVDFSWRDNDSLHIQVTTATFALHPVTGERCFRAMRYCDFNNVKFMMRELAKNQMPTMRYLSTTIMMHLGLWLASRKWVEREKYSWKTSFKEGPPLSPQEEKLLTIALFNNSTIFRWHPGDVLLVDNIKVAHGRLNVDSARTIHVFMGEYVDQRQIYGQKPVSVEA